MPHTRHALGAVTLMVTPRLQVGLIEARQDLVRVEGLEVRVDVHLVVHRVAEAVQADAGVLVLALRGHRQPVGARRAGHEARARSR